MAAITSIRLIRNRTGSTGEVGGANRFDLFVANHEAPGDTNGEGKNVPIYAVQPIDYFQCAMWIPWYDENNFDGKNIEIALAVPNGVVGTKLHIYQRDGYIYYRQGDKDYLVSGKADENGDRTVDVTGTTIENADVTFY